MYVAIRDRLRIPFSSVDESRISFDDIRGVGTVRMTASDPMSSHRMVTLHLDGHDRYLISEWRVSLDDVKQFVSRHARAYDAA